MRAFLKRLQETKTALETVSAQMGGVLLTKRVVVDSLVGEAVGKPVPATGQVFPRPTPIDSSQSAGRAGILGVDVPGAQFGVANGIVSDDAMDARGSGEVGV